MSRGKKRKLKRCIVVILLFGPLLLLLFLQLCHLTAESYSVHPPTQHLLATKYTNPFRPPLEALLTPKGDIIGDPGFLLDVAIVGFPKCGTTALQDWLSQHPQIKLLPGEPFPLMNRKPYLLIWKLYTQLPPDGPVKFVRGYKNPLDIRAPPSMQYLAKLFPKTLLIVGLRHPVPWFESLYNFKVQNLPPKIDPAIWGDPNALIDECEDWTDPHCVGTAKGWFHVYLAALRKVSFPVEWSLDYPRYLGNLSLSIPIPNPIFLYESNQLKWETSLDSNTAHYANQFRNDLQSLLRLDSPLDRNMSRAKPDMNHFNDRQQRRKDRHKIRICDERYTPLRSSLMVIARRASTWIRHEFVNSPDVFVSSPEYFETLMEQWKVDPCTNNKE